MRMLHGGHQHAVQGDAATTAAQETVTFLLENHFLVGRNVTFLPDGSIQSHTYAEDPVVIQTLQDHVKLFKDRLHEHLPVRPWDPIFVELSNRVHELDMVVENRTDGVEVLLFAWTPCGQALIEAHSQVVSLFVETGNVEGNKAHDIPELCVKSVSLEGDDEEESPTNTTNTTNTTTGDNESSPGGDAQEDTLLEDDETDELPTVSPEGTSEADAKEVSSGTPSWMVQRVYTAVGMLLICTTFFLDNLV